MGRDSGVSWTHDTHNLWWGCDKVSPGCKNCYADGFARRTGHDVWGPTAPRRFFGAEHLDDLKKYDRIAQRTGERRRVFCSSMCDLFERHLNPEFRRVQDFERGRFFDLVPALDGLDLLLLTKRPQNIRSMVPVAWMRDGFPRNVWPGASVENKEQAGWRLPELLRLDGLAPVLWASYEPALELVTFSAVPLHDVCDDCDEPEVLNAFAATTSCGCPCDSEAVALGALDWIVVGAESGGKRRPFDPAWADAVVAECADELVACYVKQDSALRPGQQGRISDATWAVKQFPSSDA